jgi:monofunctional biosynthetic peptidoglycan transglycosylase
MSRRRSLWRRALRAALYTVLGAVLLSIVLVAALRFIDPWTSSVMVRERVASWFDGEARPYVLRHEWRDYDAISQQLALAVVAAEDQRFPEHWGFDFSQIRKALDEAQNGGRSRGASTISQQVAKNLFLWNGRSWVRKGAEAWFTLLLETLWPKQRILEVYLNIAEMGPGIYGAEAAAKAFFGKPAVGLSREQAARIAAVLPNPKRMSVARPGPYVLRRQAEIQRQMAALGGTSWLHKALAR